MFSYSASGAWPQLFPSHRRIPVQTERNIADEQMCFKNGRGTRPPVCSERVYSPARLMKNEDGATQGATRAHMHEHTCTNTRAEICRDMQTHSSSILNLLCANHKREMTPKPNRSTVGWPERPQIWDIKKVDVLIKWRGARDRASFTPSKERKNTYRRILFWNQAIPSHTLTFQQVIILCVYV